MDEKPLDNTSINKKRTKKKLKYKSLNIKNWGIDYNKNEYKEIILSNSNHPEIIE